MNVGRWAGRNQLRRLRLPPHPVDLPCRFFEAAGFGARARCTTAARRSSRCCAHSGLLKPTGKSSSTGGIRQTPSSGCARNPSERVREARRNYLGMISWVDEKVGLILRELDRLDIRADTLVIFASDHGEMPGEHGQWWKLPHRGRSRRPAVGRSATGCSRLLPMDRREESGDREVVGEYLGEGPVEPVRMVVRRGHKYITVNGHARSCSTCVRIPGETTNRAGSPAYAVSVGASRSSWQMSDFGAAPRWSFTTG